jgi:hypothetical protein
VRIARQLIPAVGEVAEIGQLQVTFLRELQRLQQHAAHLVQHRCGVTVGSTQFHLFTPAAALAHSRRRAGVSGRPARQVYNQSRELE